MGEGGAPCHGKLEAPVELPSLRYRVVHGFKSLYGGASHFGGGVDGKRVVVGEFCRCRECSALLAVAVEAHLWTHRAPILSKVSRLDSAGRFTVTLAGLHPRGQRILPSHSFCLPRIPRPTLHALAIGRVSALQNYCLDAQAMAPLILHNVPDDELYIGDDGIKRPYAMLFGQLVPP